MQISGTAPEFSDNTHRRMEKQVPKGARSMAGSGCYPKAGSAKHGSAKTGKKAGGGKY